MNFLATIFFVLPCLGLSFESRLLGDLDISMRSKSSTNVNDLLLEVLSVTVGFLDEQFEAAYESSSTIQFTRTSLSALSYDIQEEASGHTATLHLEGRAFFEDGTSPSQDDVSQRTMNIFKENNAAFLQALMKSSDDFLRGVSYAVVTVDGNVVAEERNANAISTEPKSSIFEFTTLSIILMSVFGGVMLFMLACLVWYCCSSVQDEGPEDIHPALRKAVSRATGKTAEDESYMKRPPSPVRSITSQDSSIFTYNPKSCKSMESRTFGSFAAATTGTEMDLEAWKNGSKVQKDSMPFGHDISAIEAKKDLSLIEEGSEGGEDVTPDRHNLSRVARVARETAEHSLLTLETTDRKIRCQSSRLSQGSRHSSSSKNSKNKFIDLEGDAAEVINDLNDLSYQIDRYRSS